MSDRGEAPDDIGMEKRRMDNVRTLVPDDAPQFDSPPDPPCALQNLHVKIPFTGFINELIAPYVPEADDLGLEPESIQPRHGLDKRSFGTSRSKAVDHEQKFAFLPHQDLSIRRCIGSGSH